MATKIINHQNWEITDKHYVIKLREPYWGAATRFGWEKGVEGLSVSLMACMSAKFENKKLLVDIGKYGQYEITPDKAEMEGREFITKSNTKLLCIPKTAFKKYV